MCPLVSRKRTLKKIRIFKKEKGFFVLWCFVVHCYTSSWNSFSHRSVLIVVQPSSVRKTISWSLKMAQDHKTLCHFAHCFAQSSIAKLSSCWLMVTGYRLLKPVLLSSCNKKSSVLRLFSHNTSLSHTRKLIPIVFQMLALPSLVILSTSQSSRACFAFSRRRDSWSSIMGPSGVVIFSFGNKILVSPPQWLVWLLE